MTKYNYKQYFNKSNYSTKKPLIKQCIYSHGYNIICIVYTFHLYVHHLIILFYLHVFFLIWNYWNNINYKICIFYFRRVMQHIIFLFLDPLLNIIGRQKIWNNFLTSISFHSKIIVFFFLSVFFGKNNKKRLLRIKLFLNVFIKNIIFIMKNGHIYLNNLIIIKIIIK